MKYITFFLFISVSINSQSITTNDVDEFTKVKFIETNISKEKRIKEIDNIT
jgi:hypothetical protein